MSQKNILIVENDPSLCVLLEFLITENGYNPIIVDDGTKALEMAQIHQPDLILLETKLPNQSGFKICQSLKGIPSLQDKKVILLISTDREEDIKKGNALGATGYLRKPFSARELVAMIRKLMGDFS